MGLDVLPPQEHAQQRLAVRQPADAEVAEERLGGDVGELDLLVQTSLAQPVCGIEQELVRRAETARALRRGDHHIARIGEEAAPGLSGADRIRQGSDGDGVLHEAGDRVHLVAVTSGYHEVVVPIPLAARGLDPLVLGVDLHRGRPAQTRCPAWRTSAPPGR